MTDYRPGISEIAEYQEAMRAAGITHSDLINSAKITAYRSNQSAINQSEIEGTKGRVSEKQQSALNIRNDTTLVTDLGQFQLNDAIQKAQLQLSKDNAALVGRFIVGLAFNPPMS